METDELLWSSSSATCSSELLSHSNMELSEEEEEHPYVPPHGHGGNPTIKPPQTPRETMEFLSRSWSISSSAISRAILANGKKRSLATSEQLHQPTVTNGINDFTHWHGATVGSRQPLHDLHLRVDGVLNRRWLGVRDSCRTKLIKKERDRADRARAHAAVSVAAVAAAVATFTADVGMWQVDRRMGAAVSSAAELLASHLAEVAGHTGADSGLVASTVRSAADVRTAGHLTTLTAAAATALRGAATTKLRLNSAAVMPLDRGPCVSSDALRKEGHLLKWTRGGRRHWKQVSIHINKKSQVAAEIKGKSMGGAFSKKRRCIVYDVYEEKWHCFRLDTSQGSLKFECTDEMEKQKWTDGVQNLLDRVRVRSRIDQSMELLRIG